LFLYKVGLGVFLVEKWKFQTPALNYIKMTVIIFLKKVKIGKVVQHLFRSMGKSGIGWSDG